MVKKWVPISLLFLSPVFLKAGIRENIDFFPYELELCSNHKTKKNTSQPSTSIQKEQYSFDPLTDEEKSTLSQFIADLSSKTIDELLLINFEKRLAELKSIYPLIVIEYIFSEPILYEQVRSTLQDDKKLRPIFFILSLNLHKAKQEGVLEPYILQFAELKNFDKDLIQLYVEKENYTELVKYIFQL